MSGVTYNEKVIRDALEDHATPRDGQPGCTYCAGALAALKALVAITELRAPLAPIEGDPSPGHSVRVPPRTPQVGERWLHDRLGEVEVLDTSTYRPDGAEWLVVQSPYSEDRRRWSVPPASLIGRAE